MTGNPNHDPKNGEFTSGGGGHSGSHDPAKSTGNKVTDKATVGWKKDYPGRYVHISNTVIERNLRGSWNVVNPQTGKVLDSLPTKKLAMKIYGGGIDVS